MEKELYDLFFDDCEGIFTCMRNNKVCEGKKEEAIVLLTKLNEKFSNNSVTNIELKVFNAIIVELALNCTQRMYSDFFMVVEKIMLSAFLTIENYKMLKGE